jgi:hypothetical protein
LPDAASADTSTRTIDFPLEKLPPIDEHGVLVHASQPVVWEALLTTVPSGLSRKLSTRFARILGCSETEAVGDPGRIGSTMPGFVVARVVEPAVLALEGQHRFSRYGLVFRLEPTKDERTLLRAESRAQFPGILGRIYKLLVIGTRGHVLAVNSMLRGIKRRAERSRAREGPRRMPG